uniref:Uncharacterized protein n=1 Tax=Heterorhabditis bacteriophora TaxID=37862 RepID=A0A1I7WCV4_HETBA
MVTNVINISSSISRKTFWQTNGWRKYFNAYGFENAASNRDEALDSGAKFPKERAVFGLKLEPPEDDISVYYKYFLNNTSIMK